ncbi:MAG: hypothetical protein Q8R33_15495 [Burkholderiales bacterium]|nr:hypothetical protein [Burkholderiales bacterium]
MNRSNVNLQGDAHAHRLQQAQDLIRDFHTSAPADAESLESDLQWLRTDQAAIEAQQEAHGRALGVTWSRTKVAGRAADLKRVAALAFDGLGDDEPSGAAAKLSTALLNDEQPSWADVGDAMENVFASRTPSVHEIHGFVDGAREIFDLI